MSHNPSLDAKYDYDLKGRITKEEDLSGLKSIFEYHNRNQLISKTSDQLIKVGEESSIKNILYGYLYDNNGNLLEEKLEGNISRTFEYDKIGNQSEI